MTSNKKKHISSFDEFSESDTSNYTPPKYVVQPPVNDTGWEMFKTAFDKQKSYFKPKIKSTNLKLSDDENSKDKKIVDF